MSASGGTELCRRTGVAASSQHLRVVVGELLVTEYSLCPAVQPHFAGSSALSEAPITVGGDPLDITLESLVLGAGLCGLTLV